MPFTVRAALPDDLETLVAFTLAEAMEAEGRGLQPDVVRRGVGTALANPDIAMYWVLEDVSGQAVGSISVVTEWSNWGAGYYWWIQSLYICPENRGHGLMRRLLVAVVEEAQEKGALELRLIVHHDNARATRAYVREGFEEAPYVMMAMRVNE